MRKIKPGGYKEEADNAWDRDPAEMPLKVCRDRAQEYLLSGG